MNELRVMELSTTDSVPPTPESFLDWLEGPTFLRLPGRDRTKVRALSVLTHGNEPSGFRALHGWLTSAEKPAVDIVCLIGAVEAASGPNYFAHRMPPGRRDLNRCFFPPFDGKDGKLAAQALKLFRESRPESLVDLHNNTGNNPAYCIATRVDDRLLGLTSLFATRYVHSNLRLGTLTEALENDFPSLTIECGRAGDPTADADAQAGLARYFRGERQDPDVKGMTLLTNPVRVHVRPHIRLGFGNGPQPEADLTVASEIDHFNFRKMGAGTPLGWVKPSVDWPLEVKNAAGDDISPEYFVIRNGVVEALQDIVPIMMTTSVAAARCDCLFYIVKEQPRLAIGETRSE